MTERLDFKKIEYSTDLISGYDQDLKVVIWNATLAERFDMPGSLAIGKELTELFPHIAKDFRLQCLREAATDKKTFYFSGLPYLYEEGTYSQLIIPVYGQGRCRILSIVRDHLPTQRYSRAELLKAVTTDRSVIA